MKKVYPDAKSALDGLLKDGMMIMAGGFGLCGIPETLILAIRDSGVKNLTSCRTMPASTAPGSACCSRRAQIKKMISSYVGENKLFAQQYLAGELEIEFNPQGTLAERIRAGGAGIPAFFTKTGAGTDIAKGKEEREFDGERYIMETRHRRRPLDRARLEGRHRRQPRLPQDRAQLQPDDGDRRQASRSRRSSTSSSRARSIRDHIITPGVFVKRIIHVRTPRSASSSARVRKRAASLRRLAPCPGPAIRWPSAPPRSCATASTSISASAFRRWCRTTSRPA